MTTRQCSRSLLSSFLSSASGTNLGNSCLYARYLCSRAHSAYACMQNTFARARTQPLGQATIGYLVYKAYAAATPSARDDRVSCIQNRCTSLSSSSAYSTPLQYHWSIVNRNRSQTTNVQIRAVGALRKHSGTQISLCSSRTMRPYVVHLQ